MSGSAELSVDELAKVDRISRLVEPDLSGDGRRQQTKGYLIALVRETTGDRCALRAYGKWIVFFGGARFSRANSFVATRETS